jgi:hypothetical protein
VAQIVERSNETSEMSYKQSWKKQNDTSVAYETSGKNGDTSVGGG